MTINAESLLHISRSVINLYEELNEEEKKEADPIIERITALISKATQRIQQPQQAEQPPEVPNEPPDTGANQIQSNVPDIARELWNLARGDPDTFSLYMQSYPDKSINAIASNPSQLNQLMYQINSTQTVIPRGQADGVQQAPLQSSNVYGFRYDPLTKRLTVRFQEGSVYRYDGVPKVIYDMFAHGEGVAKTSGRNRFGRWWKGKSPTLGGALFSLIKMGNYPYQRIK